MKTAIQVSTAMLKQPTILLKLGQTVTVSHGGNYWTRATVSKISDSDDVYFSAVDVPGIFSFKNNDKKYIPITSTLEGFTIVDYKGIKR